MITEWYRNPVKKKKNHGYTYEETQAAKLQLPVEEYRRRSTIVQDQCIEASKAGFYVGATCWPKTEKYAKEYGQCKVVAVARVLGDLGLDEWPATDTPLIIHAKPLVGTGGGFFGTVSFFSKEEPKFEHSGD